MALPDGPLPHPWGDIAQLAERDPSHAVSLARELAATQPSAFWGAYTLGWALLCWERTDEARSWLERALRIHQEVGHGLPALHCRHALLLVEVWHSDHAGLAREFAALSEAFLLAGAPRSAARASLDQARQLLVVGRPHEAAPILEQIKGKLRAGAPLDTIRWLRAAAIGANLTSDYPRALALLDEAEQLALTAGYEIYVAGCRVERAWVFSRQERLDEALCEYRRAEEIYRTYDLPLRLAYSARNIGRTLLIRGCYDQALPSLLDAQRYFLTLRRRGDLAVVQLLLGNLHYYTARWEVATACYLRAERLARQRGVIGDMQVARRNRAMVYREQGRRTSALRMLSRLAGEARAAGNRGEVAEIVSVKAGLYADAGRDARAMALYRQAEGLFTELGNRPAAAEARMEQAWLALRRDDQATAQQLFLSIGADLDRLPHHRWRVDYGLARCSAAVGDSLAALHSFARAVELVGTLRRRLASEHASSALSIRASKLYEDALEWALHAGAGEALLAFGEVQRATVLGRLLVQEWATPSLELQAEQQRLQQKIARAVEHGHRDTARLDRLLDTYGEVILRSRHADPHAPYASLTAWGLDLPKLRSVLTESYGEHWSILSYYSVAACYYVVIVEPGTLEVETVPHDQELQTLIEKVVESSYRPYIFRDIPYALGHTSVRWEVLEQLGRRLVPERLRRHLHASRRLLIAPAGRLHRLPWGALRLEGRWLAQESILQLIPSFAGLLSLVRTRPLKGQHNLALGCSAYGGRMPDLPAVPGELRLVASLLGSTCEILVDRQATSDALFERSHAGALQDLEVLHLAVHARLLQRRGLAGYLALCDRLVFLAEIAKLKLEGALVVLSACDGALPDSLPGDEVLSLSWAFLAARAGGVVASQWAVADAVSPRMMKFFYEGLAASIDAPLALALAQRRLIDDAGPATDLEHWGSFVFIGRGLA